jgi:hypothetical protein
MMSKTLSRFSVWLFAFAAAWGLIASLAVFFTAGATQVTESNGAPQQVVHLSWYEAQGWWGIAILLIFAALFYAPLHFMRRGQRGWAAIFAAAGIVLTVLTGFSVGGYFFIGALGLLGGLLSLPFSRQA